MRRDYPDRPFLGIGAVILRDDEVLLVKRGNEPFRGQWSVPGGVVEAGETLKETVRREALEETGLVVEPLEPVEIVERITPDPSGKTAYHFVIVDYLCEVITGDLRAASDVEEARWLHRNELPALELVPPTREVIEKAFAISGRREGRV